MESRCQDSGDNDFIPLPYGKGKTVASVCEMQSKLESIGSFKY